MKRILLSATIAACGLLLAAYNVSAMPNLVSATGLNIQYSCGAESKSITGTLPLLRCESVDRTTTRFSTNCTAGQIPFGNKSLQVAIGGENVGVVFSGNVELLQRKTDGGRFRLNNLFFLVGRQSDGVELGAAYAFSSLLLDLGKDGDIMGLVTHSPDFWWCNFRLVRSR